MSLMIMSFRCWIHEIIRWTNWRAIETRNDVKRIHNFHGWMINRRRLTFCSLKRIICLFVGNIPIFWFWNWRCSQVNQFFFMHNLHSYNLKIWEFEAIVNSMTHENQKQIMNITVCFFDISLDIVGSIQIELKILRWGFQLLLQIERKLLRALISSEVLWCILEQ